VPRRITVYVFGTTLATIGVLGWAAVHGTQPNPTQVALTGVLAVMVGGAHLYPLPLAPRTKVSVDTAPAFTAAVLLPTPLAMLASLGGIGAGEIIRRTAPVQVAYNTAVAGLRAGAAAAVFGRIAAGPLTATLNGERAAAALTAAAVTMFTVNATLIDLVIAVHQRRNPLRGWWQRRRQHLAHEATLYLLGALAAVSGARWPATVLLLTAPSVVVYRSLRDGVAVRVQTRAGLLAIADTVDARDRMPGHSERVAELARRLAVHLRLQPQEVELIALAARVHDIGNLGLRSTIFTKPGPLSPVEWREVRTHPEAGARLLRGLPELAAAAPFVLSHHERWDGRGYPQGLQGEAIPLGARIIAVADAFDAMTSERPYRRALPPAVVRAELEEGRGTQFDPRVVDALLGLLTREPQRDDGGPLP
jgi:HD-GYP domain-containing protein (c-di-GMP phosphodiesterase class II)